MQVSRQIARTTNGKLIKNVNRVLAKYPHLAVNGVLLGKKASEKSKTEVVDAVPLFHICLYASPMSEIAMVQVESRAASEGLQIVGYYAAAENFYDNSIDKAPGIKIAEKIAEINGSACVVVVSISRLFPSSESNRTLSCFTDGQQISLHGDEAFGSKSLAVSRWKMGQKQAQSQRLQAHPRCRLAAASTRCHEGALRLR